MIELRHPAENHTIPITYPSNFTYECTASEGLDTIWNVATGQYLSGVRTQLPLEGIQLQSNETISSFEEKGIYVPVSSLRNSTRLIISQNARQHNSLIQVQCISFNPATLARRFTGFYYVITYCKWCTGQWAVLLLYMQEYWICAFYEYNYCYSNIASF